MLVNCHNCSNKLERDLYRIKRSKYHYCNTECRYKAQKKMPELAFHFGRYAVKGNVGPNKGKIWGKESRIAMSEGHKLKGIEPKIKFIAIGEESPSWKGDRVGYGALHDWVRKWKGKPRICEHCGIEGNNLEWANKSQEYKRDLNDWIRLCRTCHRRYDGKIEGRHYGQL